MTTRDPVRLRDLPPGSIFEATTGWRGVKTAEQQWASHLYVCIDLGDGMRTRERGDLLVREILLPEQDR
jgi:hypothetical protein